MADADTITPERSTPRAGNGAAAAGRRVQRRRGLPGGRAVVGGFLVAVAAVGTFAAWSAATTGPRVSYVVAARDLPAGAQAQAGDLMVVAIELPSALADQAFTEVGPLVGATLLGPIARNELVQASAVVKPFGGSATVQISFSLDAANALNGDLKRGEQVDLIATYGSGENATVRTIARGALVVSMAQGREVVGSSGSVVLVVAVSPGRVENIAHAAAAGTIRVVRTTGVRPGPADGSRDERDAAGPEEG